MFGIGYLLRDNTIGVLYNDQSTMMRSPHTQKLVYTASENASNTLSHSSLDDITYKSNLFYEFERQLTPYKRNHIPGGGTQSA